ncbi:site-specific integrase [Paenibacillus macquariensis]|uniref:Site-specific recombinase XerD n=1 Tax=Paenibacillus macquariensis TaxID=948756 RepID=A0ABY1KDP4_9BACL|nr:site-specific integrase [Paenibacillus macquariensis]MEC0093433.1 site-specific integrase [Paenibacillus macquariensis]OAB26301.1 integrase [Paenibacillus macquariensis subsp. macquariensis]SIR66821.1 Site-specific recombinase XerD [Paenibacillus macquariensis]
MANLLKRGADSWRLTVNVGKNASGKYIRQGKTVHCRTKKEAEIELAKFQIEVEAGAYIAPEKLTFYAFIDEWQEKYAIKELETKTLSLYHRVLDKRILPVIGHLRLDQVKPLHIASLLSDLGKEGSRQDGKEGTLSSGTVQYVYRVMKNIFSRAVEWRVIKSNPVSGVKAPKVVHKESEVYDEEEIQVLFQAIQHEPYHWRMMITLALTTGLRRGELVGLEWKHVDLVQGTIHVKQSISVFIDGKPIIKEPKTKKSTRKINLSDAVWAELKDYYEFCKQEWDNLVEIRDNNHFFVFFNQYGKAFYPESPYLWFRGFLKKHKLRYIKFHDLRHTSATLLINKGVHAKIISERLGHANITTTMNIYGHVLARADKEAANTFDQIITFTSRKEAKNPSD